MQNSKTSKNRGFCIDDIPVSGKSARYKGTKLNPKKHLKNRKEIAIALLQCLEENDPESFVEILDTYLQINKSDMARRTKLSRQTIKNMFSGKGNPTIRTIAQIVHEAVA